MNPILLFATQLALPVLVSVLVAHYLGSVMRHLLADLCGTAERADFWVRVMSVALVAVPLVMVLAGVRNPQTCEVGSAACMTSVLRQTCVLMLVGVLVAVGIVTVVVGSTVPWRVQVNQAVNMAANIVAGSAAHPVLNPAANPAINPAANVAMNPAANLATNAVTNAAMNIPANSAANATTRASVEANPSTVRES